MAVTQRLDLRQSQSLVMTPQLQQAIKLLQLSHVELAEYVERELEQNPLLERDEAGEDQPAAGLEDGAPQPEGDDSAEGVAGTTPDTLEQANSETLPEAADQPLDTDFPGDEDTGPAADWSPGDAAFENWTVATSGSRTASRRWSKISGKRSTCASTCCCSSRWRSRTRWTA
jgi:RNA polymerase sigma-54 factor